MPHESWLSPFETTGCSQQHVGLNRILAVHCVFKLGLETAFILPSCSFWALWQSPSANLRLALHLSPRFDMHAPLRAHFIKPGSKLMRKAGARVEWMLSRYNGHVYWQGITKTNCFARLSASPGYRISLYCPFKIFPCKFKVVWGFLAAVYHFGCWWDWYFLIFWSAHMIDWLCKWSPMLLLSTVQHCHVRLNSNVFVAPY